MNYLYPGNDGQQKHKRGPEQKPAQKSGNLLDAIVKDQLEDFSALLNIMGEIAQKIKDNEYPTEKNVLNHLTTKKLAQSLELDLTTNWEQADKVIKLGFSNNPQIIKLLNLSVSARALLGNLLVDIASSNDLGNNITLKSFLTSTVDGGLSEIVNLASTTHPQATVDDLVNLALEKLETLAANTANL